jgi:ribonuclease MRP protein subunit RMP1
MSTTMAEEPRKLPSSSAIAGINSTLHLLYHRNKNQHRTAKWFKSLAMLKRWTHRLADAIERVERAIENYDDQLQEEEAMRDEVAGIIAHLAKELVPRSYR